MGRRWTVLALWAVLALCACGSVPRSGEAEAPSDLQPAREERSAAPPRGYASPRAPLLGWVVEPVQPRTDLVAAASEPRGPLSGLLPNGMHNPMPGGVFAGYRADTGLDLAGSPRPVHALLSGTLDYSEPGHTLWTGPRDTANTVRIQLDAPIPWKGRSITHVWYAHLSQLERLQREGETPRAHVEAGERLGISGTARGSPHLHIGMLLDGVVDQRWGSFLLEDDVRRVLGGYRTGARLPR